MYGVDVRELVSSGSNSSENGEAWVNLLSWNPFDWFEEAEVKINEFTEDLAEVLRAPECAYYF